MVEKWLCRIEAFLDAQGNIQWRDYIGNVFPIAISDAKEGDVGWIGFARGERMCAESEKERG